VISFCNGEFLKNLPAIHKHAKTTSWVNCMTWNFDLEIEMHAKGLIDFHLYQTPHAYSRVSAALRDLAEFRPLMITPYFNLAEFPFIESRPREKFQFGRISRPDPGKFGNRQLWIYETMTAPVLKEGLILGWNESVEGKLGKPHPYIRTLPAGAISQREFYAFCDAIIFTSDTFENLPRVGFEAMASGSVLIVDNRGGWKQLVEDGKTGWLCNDDREFVYKASRCAFEHHERDEMRKNARARVEKEWGQDASVSAWERVFAAWEKLR
jgi:glycosyltransferase involved in cell wall biosynthesis